MSSASPHGSKETAAPHRWRFFRTGGFDQVRLERGADLLALPALDQKLWVALSCPVNNVEFDRRTLELMDSDGDGRIRAPELLAAVQWAGALLRDPEELVRGGEALPLDAIDTGSEEGARLYASAREILANLGKSGEGAVSVADAADTARIFATARFNGDGIVPADVADDPETAAAIGEIIKCLGPEMDRSGKEGVSQAQVERFFSEVTAWAEWQAGDVFPLGEVTGEAAAALDAVRAKIDDHFTRCRMAAYDPRAAAALSRSVEDYAALAPRDLGGAMDEIAGFPLAAVEAGHPLPLAEGLNPAWISAMETFRTRVVAPLLGEVNALSESDWSVIKERFAGYEAWMAAKPDTVVEPLGAERLQALHTGPERTAIEGLIARDLELEEEANAIASVERLVRYRRDLLTLLNNFVSFRDFYRSDLRAIFQVGTLYLDGRSCELCVRVEDVARHAQLATLSRVYLVYCDCVRRGSGEKMTIAAAVTAGDADQLMVGRNGVFYDRQGRDWDATVVRVIDHPISIRQAFWAPYKRVARMIGEQIQKFAAARSQAVESKLASGAVDAGSGKAQATPFDVGKFAGIFAAIGLAVGAIGTALASVVTGLLELSWWQWPVAVAGALLLVSGPSMVSAWLKLRQRNLGPILDGNGWAVNAHALINIPFGTALTAVAQLPAGAQRSLRDPFAPKRRSTVVLLLLLVVAAAAIGWRQGYVDRWLPEAWRAVPVAGETVADPAVTPPPAQ